MLQLLQCLHCFLHPLFISLPLHVPLVMLSSFCLYLQRCFLQKWAYFEFVALLYLCTINNVSLAFVILKYVIPYCC